MFNYESSESEDGVFEIKFKDEEIPIGGLSYYIDEDNVAHLLFIESLIEGYGYGSIMLFVWLTMFIKPKGVTKLKLDDVSDLSDTIAPSTTRSGIPYKRESIYTKIGCAAEDDDWTYGPERNCNVDIAINRLERMLSQRKYKDLNFPK